MNFAEIAAISQLFTDANNAAAAATLHAITATKQAAFVRAKATTAKEEATAAQAVIATELATTNRIITGLQTNMASLSP